MVRENTLQYTNIQFNVMLGLDYKYTIYSTVHTRTYSTVRENKKLRQISDVQLIVPFTSIQ